MAAGQKRFSDRVLNSQIPEVENSLALGFHDLMEVRFVHAFRSVGVPWREIRSAAERAREVFGHANPFANQKFVTDGREIFAQVLEDSQEEKFLALVRNQYAFRRIISPSLTRTLDFDDATGKIDRWWIAGREKRVVVDPEFQFGQPVIAEANVPTKAIIDLYLAEGSIDRVARLYGIPVVSVRHAVEFEQKHAA